MRSLLYAYFDGTATSTEKQQLALWLKNPANHELYFEILHEWEKANPSLQPPADQDWEKLKAMLPGPMLREPHVDAALPDRTRPGVRAVRIYRWAAACLVLLLGAGIFSHDRIFYTAYVSGYGKTKTVVLPDGSRVTLNANSVLRYPRFAFLNPVRKVILAGEAEFSVIHTADHRPFVVTTPDRLEVRVLGTRFLVYSRRNHSKVVLTSGKVQLRSPKTGTPPLEMVPGDEVRIDPAGTISLKQHVNPAPHLAWKENQFLFDRSRLTDIADQLHERFGIRVSIPDDSLAATRLSGTFPAESPDEVVAMLTRLLKIKSKKTGPASLELSPR